MFLDTRIRKENGSVLLILHLNTWVFRNPTQTCDLNGKWGSKKVDKFLLEFLFTPRIWSLDLLSQVSQLRCEHTLYLVQGPNQIDFNLLKFSKKSVVIKNIALLINLWLG